MRKMHPSYGMDNLQNIEGSAKASVWIYKQISLSIFWIRIRRIRIVSFSVPIPYDTNNFGSFGSIILDFKLLLWIRT